VKLGIENIFDRSKVRKEELPCAFHGDIIIMKLEEFTPMKMNPCQSMTESSMMVRGLIRL